ncbi:DnaJ C-terminal domain-containing protein [Agrococcus sp. ARC_14]|uniref:DnaJ C-terminal domain-containing protein n=1 Tax=Agrococcus sp. ARC_14 TaxID=2919927 RepID=UPI001F05B3BA|nr:DnaJ C-terminal domain-containing protein [Agrococcus sp. ARC_14]MCH1881828.1 DnaJ domain-containing protein [Agrococcus sp. ARC_14]
MASNDWFDKDFYAVLGVTKDVSAADLKKQYRKLARQFHPDSNPGDAAAEARFKEISEAHSVLSDAKQRQEYDAVRAMAGGRPRFAPGGSGGFEDVFGGFGGGPRVQYSQGDFEDLLGGMFGGSTGGFGNRRPAKGRDVTARAALDFTSAVQGDTLKLTVGGRTMTVKIPAGVHDGQKIKLAGKGDASGSGGDPGDLILTVQVRPHPVFTMDGLNLRVDVPVTFAEATLGATIEVPTLGGSPVRLKVAPGTPSGRVLRVKGRGVAGKKGTGDLLATIQVAVPGHLTKAQVEHLEAFVEAGPNESPRDELLTKAKAS